MSSLANRFQLTHSHAWEWVAGMLCMETWSGSVVAPCRMTDSGCWLAITGEEITEDFDVSPVDPLPDSEDGATIGCMLDIVTKVYGDHVFISHGVLITSTMSTERVCHVEVDAYTYTGTHLFDALAFAIIGAPVVDISHLFTSKAQLDMGELLD